VTATRFNQGLPRIPLNSIAFTRSSDKGVSFSYPTILDSGSTDFFDPPFKLVQGSHPAGGLGGEVVVAWYNSGPDGWLKGSFKIRTARSSNHGATFDPPVDASVDSFELPYWCGPFAFYHRWWGGMFPSLAMDHRGGAHIVYTHDPVDANTPAGFSSTESGDIRYITSGSPPYTSWSTPITVNDDGLPRAQGYPAIAIDHDATVNVVWEDHRLSPTVPTSFPNSSNLRYDIFYARKVPGQGGFFRNFRVSDTSSLSAFIFLGDYIGLAQDETASFAVWTDRRNRISIFEFDNDVFGSRVIAGGGTP
jgi:hypothetical protein